MNDKTVMADNPGVQVNSAGNWHSMYKLGHKSYASLFGYIFPFRLAEFTDCFARLAYSESPARGPRRFGRLIK